jgi:hypothetical protein
LIQPRETVWDRIASGDHQDRDPNAIVTQAPAHLEAIDPRQHDIEDDRVVLGRPDAPQGILAGARNVHRQPFPAQAALDQGSHLRVILDDQHTQLCHSATSIDVPDGRNMNGALEGSRPEGLDRGGQTAQARTPESTLRFPVQGSLDVSHPGHHDERAHAPSLVAWSG